MAAASKSRCLEALFFAAARAFVIAEEQSLIVRGRTATERTALFLLEMNTRLATANEIVLPMGRKDISDYSRDFFHFWSGESAHFVAITKIEAIASFTFLSSKIWYGNSTLRVILDTAQKRIRGEPGYDKLMGHGDVRTYTDAQKAFLAELRNFARSRRLRH